MDKTFDDICFEQGWDDESIIILLKGYINTLDPTGQGLPRYAQVVADEENKELPPYE